MKSAMEASCKAQVAMRDEQLSEARNEVERLRAFRDSVA
jgi:hypothetical protein